MSQITTHILDTALGKPAEGVLILLHSKNGDILGKGNTNVDGRVANLLSDKELLEPGTYTLVFKTKAYFERLGLKAFYPEVSIQFETFDQTHYHVPLLLNPFGYSTYRGS